MNKNLIYFITSLLILVPILALTLTNAVSADSNELVWDGGQNKCSSDTGSDERNPRDIASQPINAMLGFIGIIVVVIILLGGFKWMSSAGNVEKVNEAKRIINLGVIGLIIILTAAAIAQFILYNLYSSTCPAG